MDWKNLVADLQKAGWTQTRIAAALGGKPQSWVADVAKGRYRDLKWTDGENLRKLHRKVLRQSVMCRAAGKECVGSTAVNGADVLGQEAGNP